jgi:hypothetical protein
MKKNIVICYDKCFKKFVIIWFDYNIEHNIKTHVFNINPCAKHYKCGYDFFNILKNMGIDENTSIGLLDFDDKSQCKTVECFLKTIQLLMPVNISHFDTLKMIKRINAYHKYIRHRPVNKNDANYFFDRLTKSCAVKWLTYDITFLLDNKSIILQRLYKKAMIALYYVFLKSKLLTYGKI